MIWVGNAGSQDPAGRPGRGKGEVLVYISGKRIVAHNRNRDRHLRTATVTATAAAPVTVTAGLDDFSR